MSNLIWPGMNESQSPTHFLSFTSLCWRNRLVFVALVTYLLFCALKIPRFDFDRIKLSLSSSCLQVDLYSPTGKSEIQDCIKSNTVMVMVCLLIRRGITSSRRWSRNGSLLWATQWVWFCRPMVIVRMRRKTGTRVEQIQDACLLTEGSSPCSSGATMAASKNTASGLVRLGERGLETICQFRVSSTKGHWVNLLLLLWFRVRWSCK